MGGAERYFCILENHLRDLDIEIYAAAGPGELYSQIQDKQYFIPLSMKNHAKNILRLQRYVQRLKIDVIHANSLRMFLYTVMMKKLMRMQFRVIYTKHNVTILEKKVPSEFTKILNKYADQIITVCEFEKDKLLRLGIREDLISTVYNGVDLKHFSFKPKKEREKFHIGILARLSEEKNHVLFLRVANEFENDEKVMFHIAGDGPERASIVKMIHDFKLQDKVLMHGNLKNPYEFILSLDALILTSYREVFPMVIIEAMAVGTPVLSVDVGGIKEAISHRETGLLVKEYSEKEISEQIRLLIENKTLRKELSIRGRSKAEKQFSLSQMIQNTAEQYIE
ncbi:glycosyltransferase family 4 protein [Ureibacillus acetophenoni]|nr:glycosyltransferase family 4 protein [Ureibacillus acetophenoni]